MNEEKLFKNVVAYSGHNIKCQGEFISGRKRLQLDFDLDKIQKILQGSHKLLLRSMDDLNKQIEHCGEVFIPLGKLHYTYVLTPTGKRTKAQYDVHSDYGYIGTVPLGSNYLDGIMIYLDNIGKNEYRIVQKLISWGFDVFGLIEAGYATDISTLELNPYN